MRWTVRINNCKLRTGGRFAIFCFAAVAVAAMSAVSCAKAETEDTTVLEKLAFEAWIQKYVLSDGTKNVARQSNGMYVEFFADGDGDQSIDSSRDTVVWLRLDYTARDTENNVFVTRDSMEALRQRTFTPYTYYVPEYIFCSEQNYNMFEGQYFALRNDLVKPDGTTMKMSLGSRVRLYIPSYLAYGTNGFSDDQGYGGQYALGGNRIVIHDLTVTEVVKDPVVREENLVKEFAEGKWGLTENDTITKYFYIDTNFTPRDDLLAQFPKKEEFDPETDTLDEDSNVKIWFVGRFLPSAEYPEGFIFDTNIETVYDEFYDRRKNQNYTADDKTFSAISYTPSSNKDSYVLAFYKAVPSLVRGQWSRIVFTSDYGYGVTGLSASLKEQQEYYNNYYSYYYSSMYSSSYYDNYYYGGNYDYYNYSSSYYSETESEQEIITEIQSYTPLIFEIYIEAEE